MVHYIENDKLICGIESVGAEIRSLIDKETGQEYIWQIDNSIWGSSSPVLFPAIGTIKSNNISYKGVSYAMPKHGMVRNNKRLLFKQISKDRCRFTLISSEETKKQYPFDFRFDIIYELIDNRLVMKFEVENKDEVPMPFVCGGHTAYACPVVKNTLFSDFVIELPTKDSLVSATLGASGLLSNRKRIVTQTNGTIALSKSLFSEDALIFANIDFEWVRLRHKKSTKGVVVRFRGYPHLALWTKQQGDFICIEPWLGLPDGEDEPEDITQKSTFKKLLPKRKFSISIDTEIE